MIFRKLLWFLTIVLLIGFVGLGYAEGFTFQWDGNHPIDSGTVYFVSTAVDNDGYESDDSDEVSHILSPTTPDIKANGSDGPVTISVSDTLSLTVALEAGDLSGADGDWWLVAQTPLGWYHSELVGGWKAGFSVTQQGPIYDLAISQVYNKSGLQPGTYNVYFGVDNAMNGNWDGAQYYDSVEVTVEPIETNAICGNMQCEITEDLISCSKDCKDSEWSVNHGLSDSYTQLSELTQNQLDFINQYFTHVMTGSKDNEIRSAINGPQLTLHRNINGYYPDYNKTHFDWNHLNSHENMFFHSDESPYLNNRIITPFNTYLMNGYDVVGPSHPEAMNHWINYFTVNVVKDMLEYDYDALYIDSAHHRVANWLTQDLLISENYDDESYTQLRYDVISYIKSLLPDKIVIFNTLHDGEYVWPSLDICDGGVWELFVFTQSKGYVGYDKWKLSIDMVEKYKDDKILGLVSKKKGVFEDAQARNFILGSYLLVKNSNVTLGVTDKEVGPTLDSDKIYFLPEFVVPIGKPTGSYYMQEHLFRRDFESGFVLVNPHNYDTYSYTLDTQMITFEGVGIAQVNHDGSLTNGSIKYKFANGKLDLLPQSAAILLFPPQ